MEGESVKMFRLTEDHVTLLRNANVWWWNAEYGAPCIDPKRPYGNSDVVEDMAKLMGIDPVETDDGDTHFPKGTADKMRQLHLETQTALQVVLSAGSFQPGIYVCGEYDREWKLQS